MKAKVGMKFYDAYSGTHEVTRIDEKNKGFFHIYMIGKNKVESFMYDIAFERLLNANAIFVI